MSKRWSKLQKRLYNLIEPSMNFQIHCMTYEMNSNDGWHGSKLPRLFITIGKEIIFDYPKDFDMKDGDNTAHYLWYNEISDINNVIEEYIECPLDNLMKSFENDIFGLTDILRVCDRRVGKRRLREIQSKTEDKVILSIIQLRLNK